MKYLFGLGFGILSLIIGIAVWQYLFCPQFDFTASTKFSGNRWYNPYAETNSSNWVKCNFHAHTTAWRGFTCGNGSARDIRSKYAEMNYGVHCVSDYQYINHEFSTDSNYIPAYEHGYNLMKAHQLVIGGDKVTWADFFFPQSLSNKQWVLNHLNQSSNEVIVLNHPEVREAYTPEDMKFLTGYRCMEVLNPSAQSFTIWDAALSSGKAIFITGNDDVHNVLDRWDTGRFCTWLNLAKVNKQSVVAALNSGRGYGMEIGFIKKEDSNARRKRIRDALPYLKSCQLQNDSLIVEFNQPASQIQFIGQGGKIIETKNDACKAIYTLNSNDCYIRIGAVFSDCVKIYLNPVFRYSSQPFIHQGGFALNKSRTIFMRSTGILVFMGWVLILIRFYSRTQSSRKSKEEPVIGEMNEPALVDL